MGKKHMIKKYRVKVTETLERTVYVEGISKCDAEDTVQHMYRDLEVILSADDFTGVEIKAEEISDEEYKEVTDVEEG